MGCGCIVEGCHGGESLWSLLEIAIIVGESLLLVVIGGSWLLSVISKNRMIILYNYPEFRLVAYLYIHKNIQKITCAPYTIMAGTFSAHPLPMVWGTPS